MNLTTAGFARKRISSFLSFVPGLLHWHSVPKVPPWCRMNGVFGLKQLHCRSRPHFVSPSSDGLSGSFRILAVVNNAVAWLYKYLKFSTFSYFGCILRTGIVGSCGNSVFSFLRNCHIVFILPPLTTTGYFYLLFSSFS